MKYLIVNADGFGFTEGCNLGIFEAIENGIVSSVSVNMNFPPAEETLKLQKEYNHISIGVHLNPIVGKPVSDLQLVPSLINPATKEFFGGPEFVRRLSIGAIRLKELEMELRNQLKKAFDMGINVTHIDSHQDRHLHPSYFRLFLKVGAEFGIKKMRTHNYYFLSYKRSDVFKYYFRNPTKILIHNFHRFNMAYAKKMGFKMADRNLVFILLKKGAKYLLENWVFALNNLPEGCSEVYLHPAYPDQALHKYASYVSERESERKIIQEPVLKEIIMRRDIKLINYREL
jgi:hypothetical protein